MSSASVMHCDSIRDWSHLRPQLPHRILEQSLGRRPLNYQNYNNSSNLITAEVNQRTHYDSIHNLYPPPPPPPLLPLYSYPYHKRTHGLSNNTTYQSTTYPINVKCDKNQSKLSFVFNKFSLNKLFSYEEFKGHMIFNLISLLFVFFLY
jgi:hypothetical protein